MLVLTRKLDQSVMVGDDVKIIFIKIKGKEIQLGFEAPKHIRILRTEVHERINQELQEVATS